MTDIAAWLRDFRGIRCLNGLPGGAGLVLSAPGVGEGRAPRPLPDPVAAAEPPAKSGSGRAAAFRAPALAFHAPAALAFRVPALAFRVPALAFRAQLGLPRVRVTNRFRASLGPTVGEGFVIGPDEHDMHIRTHKRPISPRNRAPGTS
jgi:hypothetical protein